MNQFNKMLKSAADSFVSRTIIATAFCCVCPIGTNQTSETEMVKKQNEDQFLSSYNIIIIIQV